MSTLPVVAAAVVSALRAGSPPIPPDPVGDYDFPDPAAAYFDGVYYAFGGSIMMESSDLALWSPTRHYLARPAPWADAPGYGGAPGAPVKLTDDSYLMTFQAEEKNCTRPVCTCIGAAHASHPAGPYAPTSAPITCMEENDGAIDSSPRQISGRGGGLHVYWKSTGWNSLERPSQLWGARLHGNGTLASEPVNLLNQTAAWEAKDGVGCIEGPALLERVIGGRRTFHIFYSGGDWTAGLDGTPYSIGYAQCQTALGPCAKKTQEAPWFGPTYNGSVGTGGQDFFTDGAGAQWIVFHAWKKGQAGYDQGGARTVRFKPMSVMPDL